VASPQTRGAAPVPVTFFLRAQEESNQRRRAPRRAATTSQARVVALRCSPGPAVCATRAASRFLRIHRARISCESAAAFQLAQCSPETPCRSARARRRL